MCGHRKYFAQKYNIFCKTKIFCIFVGEHGTSNNKKHISYMFIYQIYNTTPSIISMFKATQNIFYNMFFIKETDLNTNFGYNILTIFSHKIKC